jgi:hypothetical protein
MRKSFPLDYALSVISFASKLRMVSPPPQRYEKQ